MNESRSGGLNIKLLPILQNVVVTFEQVSFDIMASFQNEPPRLVICGKFREVAKDVINRLKPDYEGE